MKRKLRIFALILVIAFGVMQFFPASRDHDTSAASSLETTFPLPDSVAAVLRPACYDCHSGSTTYPWYAHVQPAGWMIEDHVREGKSALNFDAFGSYHPRRQFRKLTEIDELVAEGDMPLLSYRLLHPEARLTETQKRLLREWTIALRETLSVRFAPDSLERRRP